MINNIDAATTRVRVANQQMMAKAQEALNVHSPGFFFWKVADVRFFCIYADLHIKSFVYM